MNISRTICIGFAAIIMIGTLLLTLPISIATGQWGDPITALFTSTSAVCVTGLVVVDTGTYFSWWGQLFIMMLIQVGGLGYMTMTTFLLILLGRKFDLRQKFAIQESFDRTFIHGSRQLIKSIIGVTLLFEIGGALWLGLIFASRFPLWQSLWFGVFHSVSAWNNAGFGLLPNSLMDYQSSLGMNLIVPLLIIFGGAGYQVILEAYTLVRQKLANSRESPSLSLNFQVSTSTTFLLLLAGTFALLVTESQNPSTLGAMASLERFMAAWFQSVSTRTAGFNTIDIGKMTTAGLFMMIALMFIGASPGSTGGGIKTTTARILVSCTKAVLLGKEEVDLYERQLPIQVILKAIGVLVGSVATVITATVLVTLVETKLEFIQVLFEVVSAFATVGLSTGITPALSSLSKLIIIATMYVGRVGILLLIAAIIGDTKPSRVHYPEENLLVG